MSLIIKGMHLPKTLCGEPCHVDLRIFGDGKTIMLKSTPPYFQEFEAVPLPEKHGRLIDGERMTNADKIRAMTDGELASLFEGWIQNCDCNAVPCQESCTLFDGMTCFMRWLDWLKKEVK